MSSYFNYSQSSLPVINQVNDLADELENTFTKIEEVIEQDSKLYQSNFSANIGSLDTKYLKEYSENVVDYRQALIFDLNSKEASLDLIPLEPSEVVILNLDSPSTVYTYKLPTELIEETDFTVIGKKVILNSATSEDIVATYDGFNLSNFLGSTELLHNVITFKDSLDPNIEISEFEVSGLAPDYSISGFNFKSKCSPYIQNLIDTNSPELSKYISIFNVNSGGVIEKLTLSNVDITNSNITFETEDTVTTSVKVFVANSSIGELLEGIYKLFYKHDHKDLGTNISHNSLLSLFNNTETIQYQNVSKVNYDHPQYFNREGYIADGTLYNNAVLGDILLASTDLVSNRGNNTLQNSVKLIFGEYSNGHSLNYNFSGDVLYLDSKDKNGLFLSTLKNKQALIINEHIFSDIKTVTDLNYLELMLEAHSSTTGGILRIVSKSIDPVTEEITAIDEGKIEVRYIDVGSIFVKESLILKEDSKILFGHPNHLIEIYLDDLTLKVSKSFSSSVEDVDLGLKVSYEIDTYFKKLYSDVANIKSLVINSENKLTFDNNQNIDYNSGQLNINVNESVNFKNNGRRTGLTFDNRQFIYSSAELGIKVSDPLVSTDLYIENNGTTYFIKNTQGLYQVGVTSLANIVKSNISCGDALVENVVVTREDGVVRGVALDKTNISNNRIFAGPDTNNILHTVVESSGGLIVASNYSPAGTTSSTITYGDIKALRYFSIGNKDTIAGYYGNVIVPVNHKLEVFGLTLFQSEVTFNSTLKSTTLFEANSVKAVSIKTEALEVTGEAKVKRILIEDPTLVSRITNLDITRLKVDNAIVQNNSDVENIFNGSLTVVGGIKTYQPIDMSNQTIINLTNSAEPLSHEAVSVQLLEDRFDVYDMSLQTQIDTKIQAALNNLMNRVWPMGSLYFNGSSTTNPGEASMFNFGTWTRALQGRSPMGISETLIGGLPAWTQVFNYLHGAYTVSLTGEQNGPHNHTVDGHDRLLTVNGTGTCARHDNTPGEPNLFSTRIMLESGAGAPHENVHPVEITAIWKRVG